jgi:ribose/xylose/arabinose/galactoside ABC-type transport system permease subunit
VVTEVVHARSGAPAAPLERLRSLGDNFGTLLVAVAIAVGFGLTSNVFLAVSNIRNISIQVSVIAVAAIGETVVMLMGGLDLSVGANVLLSSVVSADLFVNQGLPMWLGICLGVLAATGIGWLNGMLVTVVGIQPILATLGTSLLAGGLAEIVLNTSYIAVNNAFFANLVERNVVWQLPQIAVVMLALYAISALLMRSTPFGRAVYAIGGNPAAARVAGLRTGPVRISGYALAGMFAGFAGILQIAQVGLVSSANTTNFAFEAIIAALVGGLSVTSGGVGRVERTLLGALIVGMVTNYQTIEGIPANYQQALLGGILLVAIVIDRVLRKPVT